jgi:ethanolaminephosphotransferase
MGCRWAIGMFLYQTFDAVDGYVCSFCTRATVCTLCFGDRKQARRTGMAGPLGEMFDHGACEAAFFCVS